MAILMLVLLLSCKNNSVSGAVTDKPASAGANVTLHLAPQRRNDLSLRFKFSPADAGNIIRRSVSISGQRRLGGYLKCAPKNPYMF